MSHPEGWTPVRRGDLVVAEKRNTSVGAFGSRSGADGSSTVYYVGRVVSQRDGQAISIEVVTIGGMERVKLDGRGGWGRIWVQSAKDVDVPKLLEAARRHTYPGHPRQPKPFDSLAEIRQLAKPL